MSLKLANILTEKFGTKIWILDLTFHQIIHKFVNHLQEQSQ
jgi:hypothetical protein